MRSGWGLAALVVGVLAGAPDASADDWRFEYRSGSDYRYQPYRGNSWGPRRHRVREQCWSELHPGPFGYTEVVRCQPVRFRGPPGWGPPRGYYWYRR